MKPKKQNHIIFNNKCNAKYIHSELEAALLWYADGEIISSKRTIYLHGEYPAVSFCSEVLYAQRLLCAWQRKKHLNKKVYVRFKDKDKLNVKLENLEITLTGGGHG